jgi:transcriptional regulator with XRE-family HTH domain
MSVLGNLLRGLMEREGWSEREVARRTGLSNTTINNILKGEPVNINTLLVMARFLGLPPSQLLDSFLPEINDYENAIDVIIKADPRLARVFRTLAQMVSEGKATRSDIEEIVRYAAYRLKLNLEENNSNHDDRTVVHASTGGSSTSGV